MMESALLLRNDRYQELDMSNSVQQVISKLYQSVLRRDIGWPLTPEVVLGLKENAENLDEMASILMKVAEDFASFTTAFQFEVLERSWEHDETVLSDGNIVHSRQVGTSGLLAVAFVFSYSPYQFNRIQSKQKTFMQFIAVKQFDYSSDRIIASSSVNSAGP